MDGIAGQSGWRWIMIIEGLPTFVLGIACWWILADDPDTAYYLNSEEKAMIIARRNAQLGQSDIFEWKDVRKGLKDWKIYAICAGQFCTDNMLYGYSTFLPTIIEGIKPDASAAIVQVLTIPCYTVGAISLHVSSSLQRTQLRGPVVVGISFFSIIGYALLVSPWELGRNMPAASSLRWACMLLSGFLWRGCRVIIPGMGSGRRVRGCS